MEQIKLTCDMCGETKITTKEEATSSKFDWIKLYFQYGRSTYNTKQVTKDLCPSCAKKLKLNRETLIHGSEEQIKSIGERIEEIIEEIAEGLAESR